MTKYLLKLTSAATKHSGDEFPWKPVSVVYRNMSCANGHSSKLSQEEKFARIVLQQEILWYTHTVNEYVWSYNKTHATVMWSYEKKPPKVYIAICWCLCTEL